MTLVLKELNIQLVGALEKCNIHSGQKTNYEKSVFITIKNHILNIKTELEHLCSSQCKKQHDAFLMVYFLFNLS